MTGLRFDFHIHFKLEFARGRAGSLLARIALLVSLVLTGCTGFNPANTRLEKYDPNYGYRIDDGKQHRDVGDVIVYLAFSGGGTRAAAFAYGVLEELHATRISTQGQNETMLEEVDTISGVSGGSFPAAYYGLFGDRIFEDFEDRFLKKNIQGALMLSIIRPWNLVKIMTPWLSRSDLASRYYDKHVFDHATYADLEKANGPRIHINATDLSSGERFTFNQGTFDIICSDIDVLPISTAVASSSAVPLLLSPITLENFAGTCGYEPPEWVQNAVANRHENPRRNRSAEHFINLQNSDEKKFIHLVDGGISDNLGLRATIDLVSAAGGAEAALKVHGLEKVPRHLVFMVVNAETDPSSTIDLASAAPSFAQLMNSVSGGQIRRYNFETLMLVNEMVEKMAMELVSKGHEVDAHFISVDFENLEDPERRRYFKRIPTSFVLTDHQVDELRAAGRQLLRESPDFQRLVEQLQ